jgi:hypothetical protein
VRCGNQEIPFDTLAGGLLFLQSYDSFLAEYPINHFIQVHYQSAHHLPRLPLGDDLRVMMFRNRACGVTDSKDRIYGLYSMLVEQGIVLPRPSYAKSVGDIYWEFMVAVCQHTRSIQLLQLVSGMGNLDVPSWVPDFNDIWRAGDSMGTPHATKNSTAEFQFSDDNKTLVVRGKFIDFVYKKSTLAPWYPPNTGSNLQDSPLQNLETGYEQTIRAFRDMTRVFLDHGSLNIYDDYETSMAAFGESLLQGLRMKFCGSDALYTWIGTLSSLLTEENRDADREYVKAMPFIHENFHENPARSYLTDSEDWQTLCTLKTHPRTARLQHAIWMLMRDRVFFTTLRGYVATASRSVEENDVIVLVAGVERPMVLRQMAEDESTGKVSWKVLGPAYVAGMMEGELWDVEEEGCEMRDFCLV